MPKRQIWMVSALALVFAWSVAMAALGQAAAMVTLVPSLGLLVQQIVQAVAGTESAQPAPVPRPAGHDAEHAE
jgi:hypothetical protein